MFLHSTQLCWFATKALCLGFLLKLLHFLLPLFVVQCCGHDADAGAGFTPARTSQPVTALQQKEVSKVLLGYPADASCLFLRLP